jgi:hypothetical protein
MITEILSSLCALPHRYSTSSNEHRAAKYLTEKLADLEIEAERVPFVAPTTFSWIYLIIYTGFVAAVAVNHYHPLAGLTLALVSAVIFYGEQTTRFTPLSRWVPQGLSHNVIGHVHSPAKSHQTIVLSAHYDTSKTGAAFHPKMVSGLRRAYFISLFMIGMIILGGIVGVFAPAAVGKVVSLIMFAPGTYLAFMGLLMVEREVRGIPVNGAADNASGVAVVMELAKRIKMQGGLPGWEVIVLLTGSEEVGMAGMAYFMAEEGKTLDRGSTVFLNFDNLGGGKLNYISKEGMLFPLPADPALLKIADTIASRDPRLAGVTPRAFNALTLDSLVPRARGYRVLSFMGLNDAGVPQPWHWHDDTLPNLDTNLVNQAADFAWAMLNQLSESAPS